MNKEYGLWMGHTGRGAPLWISKKQRVRVKLANGEIKEGQANYFNWWTEPLEEQSVVAYSIIHQRASTREEILEENLKKAVELLGRVVGYAESMECYYEDTYRSGVIWAWLRDCGEKWADDVEPFKTYQENSACAEAEDFMKEVKDYIKLS